MSFSGAGADSRYDTINQISAYIDDVDGTATDISTVTAKGNVSLSATDSSTATADVGSGALNFGVMGASVGVSLSDNTINNTVKAYIDNASVTAENGGINVTGGSTGFIDALTVATSVAISIGGAGAGGDADASITTGVEAYAGSGATLTAGQDIILESASNYSVPADSYGIAAGIAAVGTGLAKASANGGIKAHMDGSVTQGQNLFVQAEAINTAEADTFGLAGGIISGAGADSSAFASPTISTSIGDGADVQATGAISLISRSELDANADAMGISVGCSDRRIDVKGGSHS